MKFIIKILLIFVLISFVRSLNSQAQIKSVSDNDTKSFNIGFEIFVPALVEVKIIVYNEDKSKEYILFDSTLEKEDSLIFIFQNYYEKEKDSYINREIYQIPITNSGFYHIVYSIKKKFLYIK